MTKPLSRMFAFLFLVLWVCAPLVVKPARAEEPSRVVILPFRFQAKENLDYLQDTIYVTISDRLIGENGIEVVEPRPLRQVLASMGDSPMDEQTVHKIATDLGADYAITGDLTKVGDTVDLNARLIGIETASPPLAVTSQYQGLEAAMEGLGQFADKARKRIVLASKAAEEEEEPSDQSTIASVYEKVADQVRGAKPPPPRPTHELETLQTFPTFVRGLGVGDVDGDGSNEIVLIAEKTLSIYKFTGGRLRLFREIEGHRNDSFLALDVADVNRNGFAEIVVTNVRKGGSLRSFILEFEKKRVRKISDRETWFFRVINRPGQGWTLVGQKKGRGHHPSGPIYPFVWKGKRFVPGNAPLMKKEVPVFSFDVGDVEGRGESRIVYIDKHESLQVVNAEGAFLWESSTKYGGSDIFYTYWSGGADKVENRVYIPSRLVTRDLDGDGVPEVIVTRNQFKLRALKKLRVYDRANLVLLNWSGIGLVENWKTPEIAGYIADYQIRDVDNDGQDEVVMAAVSKRALSGKASSAVLVYELF
jgi:TolB-like protein